MKTRDFNLLNFNTSIQSSVATQSLNFCQAISVSYDRNLSITAKYIPNKFGDDFVTLDQNLKPVFSNAWDTYYYGVSPNIDSHTIISAISEFQFSTPSGLDCFISDKCRHFMLHKEQAQYLADFARHTVLTLASKYGIRIAFSSELYDLLHPLDQEEEILKVNTLQNGNACLLLCGCPTFEMCSILENYRYVPNNNVWHLDEQGISFKDIYSNKKNITLLSGNVFYSGVLIKPLKIVCPEERFENYKTKNIRIEFERSTFAAVCSFDEVHLMHPLLKNSTENLSRLFYYDDQCKLDLCQRLRQQTTVEEYEKHVWDGVNEYLQNCYNINQIGVSANIVTKDNQLLLGLRKSKNIDAGCLYPGVNGNAEIKDDNVAFYTYSVYEDDPKIHLESKRIDFIEEISREAYAEIELSSNSHWMCYGLVLSGQMPNQSAMTPIYTQKHRRLHFNILFEKNCEQTHEEIEIKKNNATESFETSNFLGLKINCYKNFFDWLSKSSIALLNKIINSKDFIESIALLLILISSLMKRSSYTLGWLDVISYGFAILIFVVTLIKIVNYLKEKSVWHNGRIKKRLSTKNIRIFCGQPYEKMCKKIDRALNTSYHPVACAATKLHIEKVIYNLISEHDNK